MSFFFFFKHENIYYTISAVTTEFYNTGNNFSFEA